MKSDLIPTAVVIRDLKCFDIENLNNRILLQKKVYLSQVFGLPLGYGYSWYIHGPYSTDLTTVAYECIPMGKECFNGYTLSDNAKGIIDKVNDLEKPIIEGDIILSSSSWYELLASIVYLNISGVKRDKLVDKLISIKPQFDKNQVDKAIKILSNNNMLG